ncbi:MAG TPA: hypothetical protein DER40_18060 [Geobacter sp.]|nr:hypothetical protein [Geobacter sp.]
MLSTVTSKGQITIPKDIRTLLNIRGTERGTVLSIYLLAELEK